MSGLLIDIGALSCGCADHALETLQKAANGEDGRGHDIWAAHENPLISRLVEAFTEKGLDRHTAVRAELARWLVGAYHVPPVAPVAAPTGAVAHWTQQELDLVRIYLQSLPELALEDWSLLIEYLWQRYLPPDQMLQEADWLAAKSGMLGKVQAHLAGVVDAGALLGALPDTVAGAVHAFKLSDAARSVMDYGRLRAAEQIVAASESFKHAVKHEILAHQAGAFSGAPERDLEQRLFDRFADANRDWRRIAVTEAGEIANQGVVASLPVGAKVRRLEVYAGACAWCRKIDGAVLEVTSADNPDKDGETQVWAGKTNIGRSASPRKRVGDELVERTASELYWIAAGTQHPHCRGRWIPEEAPNPAHDPDFTAWVRKRMQQ